jgi:hypothetical protein
MDRNLDREFGVSVVIALICHQGRDAKRNGGGYRDGANPGSERAVGTVRPVLAGITVTRWQKNATSVKPLTKPMAHR